MSLFTPTIVLTGRKLAGKDTLARGIFPMGYTRLSFSDQLKHICHQLFPWLALDYAQGDKDLKQFRNNTLSPRDIWLKMNVVTEIDHNILIRSLVGQMVEIGSDAEFFVITDLRKPGEYEWVKKQGYPIIKIIDGTGRADISEDPLEDFIDEIEADYEFVNNKTTLDIERFKQLVKDIEDETVEFRR